MLLWEATVVGKEKTWMLTAWALGNKSLWILQILIWELDLIRQEKYFPKLPEF